MHSSQSLSRTRLLLVSAATLTSCDLFMTGSPFSAVAILSGLGMYYPHETWNLYAKFDRFCRRQRWNTVGLLALIAGFVSACLILTGSDPAMAAKPFFGAAEDWMASSFKGIDKSILALVFNVLRGLIILYLGINLVKVVQAAREGDDWQTLARTPLIIVVTVTMGDLLTGMILGTQSSGN